MEPEVIGDDCKSCCVSRNEMEKRMVQMEQSSSQQLAGFLTLKQKIIATDKIIREFQASKVECDILTRKNEEFARLIDQLHRDLNARNLEYATLYAEVAPLKKINTEQEVKVRELFEEAQKWKSEAEGGKNFTAQLVEKVKVLEKYEEEVKNVAAITKDHERMEIKIESLKGQLKDARESINKLRKELKQTQKSNQQLNKHAKLWGSVAEAHGKLNAAQKRFYQKLRNEQNDCNNDDPNDSFTEELETDKQSKLLEQLLSDGVDSDLNDATQQEILSSDTDASKGKLLSPLPVRKSPSTGQVKQTPPKSNERRRSQDTATPTKSNTTGKNHGRTRGISEQSSDTDATIESEKESDRPRTRSQRFKTPQRLKRPEPVPTSATKRRRTELAEESSTLEGANGIKSPSIFSMDNLLNVDEPMLATNAVETSLSSSVTEQEPNRSPKAIDSKIASSPARGLQSESINGIKPLEDENMHDEEVNERTNNIIDHHDKSNQTHVDPTGLLDADFDISSDSDSELEKTLSEKPKSNKSEQDDGIKMDKAAEPLTFGGIFSKSGSNSQEGLSATTLALEGNDEAKSRQIDRSSSIFNIEPTSSSGLDTEASLKVQQKSVDETPAVEDFFLPSEEQPNKSDSPCEAVTENNEVVQQEHCSAPLIEVPTKEDEVASTENADKVSFEETSAVATNEEKTPIQCVIEDSIEKPEKEGELSPIIEEHATEPVITKEQTSDQIIENSTIENNKVDESLAKKSDVDVRETVKSSGSEVAEQILTPTETPDVTVENNTSKEVLLSPESIDNIQSVDAEPLESMQVETIEPQGEIDKIVSPNTVCQNEEERKGVVEQEKISNHEETNVRPEESPVVTSADEETGIELTEASSPLKRKSNEVSATESIIEPNLSIEFPALSPSKRKLHEVTVIEPYLAKKVSDSPKKSENRLEPEVNSASSVDDKDLPQEQLGASFQESIFDILPAHTSDCEKQSKETAVPATEVSNAILPMLQTVASTEEAQEISVDAQDNNSSKSVSPKSSSTHLPTKEGQRTESLPQTVETVPQQNLQRTDVLISEVVAVPEIIAEKRVTEIPEPQKNSKICSIFDEDRPSTFKIPQPPEKPKDSSKHSTYPWSKGIAHSAKQTPEDEEVALVLKEIRTKIIPVPQTISPLPKSPTPKTKPSAPVKVEEPKCRFPILPRCAFNWTGKKLPISDHLTEQFGAYLHPGVQVRVRFRKVGKRLKDLRAPDIISQFFHGVTNFAEAERRPKPLIINTPTPAEPLEVESTIPPSIPDVHAQESTILERRRPQFDRISLSSAAGREETHPDKSAKASSHEKHVKTPMALKSAPSHKKLSPPRHSKNDKLFGSDSSSESETDEQIEIRLLKSNQISSKELTELKQRPSTTSKLKIAAPNSDLIMLGRNVRPEKAIKPIETRREVDLPNPIIGQSRTSLEMARVVKPPQPLIVPCSEALISAVMKPKSVTRVVAPLKRPPKDQGITSTAPSPAPIILDDVPDCLPKKRVSHGLKRGLEQDPTSADNTSKREKISTILSPKQTAEIPLAAKSDLSTIFRSEKTSSTEPKDICGNVTVADKTIPVSSAEKPLINRLNAQPDHQVDSEMSSEETEVQASFDSSPNNTKCSQVEPLQTTHLGSLVEHSFLPAMEDKPKSSEDESSESSESENILTTSEIQKSMLPSQDIQRPRDQEGILKLCNVEVTPQSPGVKDTSMSRLSSGNPPESPEAEDTGKVLPLEETPMSPDQSPASPPTQSLELDISEPTVIPTVGPGSPVEEITNQKSVSSAFEFIVQQIPKKNPVFDKGTKNLRKEVHQAIHRFLKSENVPQVLLYTTVERILKQKSRENPSISIRLLIAAVIKGHEDPVDMSMTPPAPPLTVVHQRCIILLKGLDEQNQKLELEPNKAEHVFTDYFLSEVSHIMFRPDCSLTLEEMCSLARAYVAVCRSRANLSRARTFLYDCLYFLPARSFALTYAVIPVWADILRHVTFPLGLSCVDQCISYLLMTCCKIKAVAGVAGKVLQVRSLLQNTYGYKNATSSTLEDLVKFMMARLKETKSIDEALSVSWSFALLVRWEGPEFAINTIEKQLWPFLRLWSSGEGTDAGAAAVIVSIGMLGKMVPPNKRAGISGILGALKSVMQSENVIPAIQESALEAIVLLGEDEDAKSIVEYLRNWQIVNNSISAHLQQVLIAFLKRHSDLID